MGTCKHGVKSWGRGRYRGKDWGRDRDRDRDRDRGKGRDSDKGRGSGSESWASDSTTGELRKWGLVSSISHLIPGGLSPLAGQS